MRVGGVVTLSGLFVANEGPQPCRDSRPMRCVKGDRIVLRSAFKSKWQAQISFILTHSDP